jgi:hypothetical protein
VGGHQGRAYRIFSWGSTSEFALSRIIQVKPVSCRGQNYVL